MRTRRPTVALAILLPFALLACERGADRSAPNGSAEAASPATAMPTSDPAPSAVPAELDDATIVAIFDAANTADIETGQLAAEKGSTDLVRAFGEQLVRDHTMVRQRGRDLAQRLGVTPTPPADDASARAHADVMQRLRGLDGAAFDRAFLDHEVQFHQSVIDAVNSTLLPAIQHDSLAALVREVAPAFEMHRQRAADLRQRIGG